MVLDYRSQDFEAELTGYDFVLDSLGGENLAKSLRVLKPGGKAVGISGLPIQPSPRAGPEPVVRLAVAALSRKIRVQAKKLGVTYEFLFMKADGAQLRQIPHWSMPAPSAPWWEPRSRSTRPRRH